MARGARWSIPIDRWAKATKGDLNKAVRACSLEIFSRVLVRSPVDTGRFRGNWMIGVQIVPEATRATGFGPGVFEGGDRGSNGAAALGEAMQQTGKLAGYRLGGTIHFRNVLPYAVKLEKGWSDQAPSGVVKVTIMEFGGIVRKVARRIRSGA